MTKWEHVHHLGKSVITVSVALIALGINFLDDGFSWSYTTLCLAVVYCLLALTVVLSLWSMAAVSDFLPRSSGNRPRSGSSIKVVLPANAAFFLFATAVLLLTIVGVQEVIAGPTSALPTETQFCS